MRDRQIGSATRPIPFLLISSSDHISGATGVTPAVTLSKNGGAFATPVGAVAEIGSGWYSLAGHASDRDTLGAYVLHASGAGCDPTDADGSIVAYDPFDAQRLGLSALPSSGTLAVKPAVTLATADVAGKLPATVATGDGADAQAIRATLGANGAGLTAVPYTGPSSTTIRSGLALTTDLAAVTTDAAAIRSTIGVAGAGLTAVPYTGPSAPTIRTGLATGDDLNTLVTTYFPPHFHDLAIAASTGLVTTSNPATGGTVDPTGLATAVASSLATAHGAGAWTVDATAVANAAASAVASSLATAHGAGAWTAPTTVTLAPGQLPANLEKVGISSGGVFSGTALSLAPTGSGGSGGGGGINAGQAQAACEAALLSTAVRLDLTQPLIDTTEGSTGGALHGAWANTWGQVWRDRINKLAHQFGAFSGTIPAKTFAINHPDAPTTKTPL